MKKAAHRVAMNTGILYARMAITVFLSLYTTRVILEALGTEDFGIFNLVGGTIAMLTFLNASMAAATQRFMSFAQGQGDETRQRSIFNVSIVLHAIIAFVILGILEGAGYILFNGVLLIDPERMQAAWIVYQYAVASTFFTILGVPYDAVINARENMLLFAVFGVIEAVLKLAIALVIVDATTGKLELYGLLMALTTVLLLIMRAAYCHHKYRECKYALCRYFSRPLFNEMTAFAGWSLLGSSTSMLANYGQLPVMNSFFGASVNAAQGISNQISGQLSVFAVTMLRALNPLIVKSEGAGNRQFMLSATVMGSKLSFFLLMLIYVPVMVEMPYLFSLWLKAVPEYLVIFCSLQMIRNLLEQFFVTLASSIAAVGDIKKFQLITSSLTLFPLLIAAFLFQQGFNPDVMYYSFIGYTLISMCITFYFAKKFCELQITDYFKNVVIRCLAAFIIVLFVSSLPLLFMESGIVRFTLVGVISVLAFGVTVWWIGLGLMERVLISLTISGLISRFQKR